MKACEYKEDISGQGKISVLSSVVSLLSHVLKAIVKIGNQTRYHYLHFAYHKQESHHFQSSTAVIFSMIDGSWDDVLNEKACNDMEFSIQDDHASCNDRFFHDIKEPKGRIVLTPRGGGGMR